MPDFKSLGKTDPLPFWVDNGHRYGVELMECQDCFGVVRKENQDRHGCPMVVTYEGLVVDASVIEVLNRLRDLEELVGKSSDAVIWDSPATKGRVRARLRVAAI